MTSIIWESQLTCPVCGATTVETMPANVCQFFYICATCETQLRPQPGDCCVFCSFGSAPCPPVQLMQHADQP